MTPPIAISARGLSKRFRLQQERRHSLKERLVRGRGARGRDFWALQDVSFDIPRGSFSGIIGHNGSGKSTALKILAGIYRPTSGTVAVNGRVSALLELGAGFHPELTGRENIQLNGAILGLTPREIRRSMDEIIEFAGIEDFADSPVKVYSSGMSVRLGFAVAVKMDPEILIVDEVIAVGDEQFQRRCNDYMLGLRRRGVTIVLVTHALGVVEDVCDEVVWLDHGRACAQGPGTEVVSQYLEHVNRREAASRSESGQVQDVGGTLRRGSGEIRVRSVEILDPQGQPIPVLVSHMPCTFRLHYEAFEAVSGFDVSIGFFTENGVCLSFAETRVDGGPHCTEAGPGFIDYAMPALPLQPGNFLISTIVARKGHFYDFADKEIALSVRSTTWQPPGAVRFTGSWGAPTQSAIPQVGILDPVER